MRGIICKCGGEVDVVDSLDIGFDYDTAWERLHGVCSNCGAKYVWTDIFRYEDSIELEEIE